VSKGFRFNTVANADSLLSYGAKEALKRARG